MQSEAENSVRILFWNTGKNKLLPQLLEIALRYRFDAMILLESAASPIEVVNAFADTNALTHIPGLSDRFAVFATNRSLDLFDVHSSDRMSIRRLKIGTKLLNLAIVHGPDKRNNSEVSQSIFASVVLDTIRQTELNSGNNASIVIGDFNSNPFEKMMKSVLGFNAGMTKSLQKNSTSLHGKEFPFFYNPMWSLFGDDSPGPPGTFFHDSSRKGVHGWNMLDQVLFSLPAVPWFDRVRIIRRTGKTNLVTKLGRPKKSLSDHLPLLLQLRILP